MSANHNEIDVSESETHIYPVIRTAAHALIARKGQASSLDVGHLTGLHSVVASRALDSDPTLCRVGSKGCFAVFGKKSP